MDIKTHGDVKVVTLLARIDAGNAKEVESLLQDTMNNGSRKIVCDFSANTYVSSAGLRGFLVTLKTMNKLGGRLVLCGLNPFVQEVFDMAGFSQLFTICENAEQALGSFSQ